MVQLVNQPIKEIKKIINRNDKWLYFYVKKKKFTYIAGGKTEKQALKKLAEKINKNPKKYIGSRLWRIDISTHNRADKKSHKFAIFGDVLIMLEHYTVKECKDHLKIISAYETGKGGQIWFQKKWLEYNGWNYGYLTNILKITIASKKNILKLFGPNMYDGKFD